MTDYEVITNLLKFISKKEIELEALTKQVNALSFLTGPHAHKFHERGRTNFYAMCTINPQSIADLKSSLKSFNEYCDSTIITSGVAQFMSVDEFKDEFNQELRSDHNKYIALSGGF